MFAYHEKKLKHKIIYFCRNVVNAKKYFCFLFVLALAAVFFLSCNSRKYLPEGESLYIGSAVNITDTAIDKSKKKNLENELEENVRPIPNKTFLKLRYKLAIYNMAGTPKKAKGLRHWLREKIGEPPVYGSSFNPTANQEILSNYLYNRGYFFNQVIGHKEIENQYAHGDFDVSPGPQYKYKSIDYSPSDSTEVAKAVARTARRSLLKPGEPYDLDIIKAERERINTTLKNRGFYYFSPDYLMLYADTTAGSSEVSAKMRLRYDIMPQNAYRRYKIRNVEVYPDYRFLINTDTTKNKRRQQRVYDTVNYQHILIFQRSKQFRPYIFRKSILFDSADFYSQRKQNASLSRLINLGTFKFVKNEFTPVADTNSFAAKLASFSAPYSFLVKTGLADTFGNQLDTKYLLTPYPRRMLSAEVGGYTQNDSRAGSKLSVTTRNRNIFKGAELFSLKLSGGFEAQYGGEVKIPNTYNVGVEASLNIPRIVLPFFNLRGSSPFVPRTLITLSYNYYLRNTLYSLHSFSAGYGYNWKTDLRQEHKLFPFNITYIHIDTFSTLASYDYNLSNLLFNGVIFGPTYEYTYNTQADNRKNRNDFYFDGVIDLSGNIVGIAQGTSVNEQPKKILDANYAQYLKFTTDFRYFRALNEKRTQNLAARLYFGYGYPYGNSYNLPNVKQYFSGGSSSLRGFQSRLVGPGTFNEQYLKGTTTFIETLGDIKLEGNLEYRAQIYRFIQGAVFMDAGNIWLLRDNPDFPGGKFSSSFLKELAVDGGVGLRFDFSILLLRFDFGIPFRKPWLPDGDRWVFNKINFGDPDWRKQNLVFSLAIGYPF